MTARPVCAICLSEVPVDGVRELHIAETTVGPLATCGTHVDAALVKLGYAPAMLDVVGWLETVDAKELEAAALELIGDYDTQTTGQAFLRVLIEAAKEQTS